MKSNDPIQSSLHGDRPLGLTIWRLATGTESEKSTIDVGTAEHPETDSFQTQGRGTALLIEIDGPDESPQVTSLRTGQYRWESLTEQLESLQDIDFLDRKLRTLDGDPNRTLVNLTLTGALSLAELQHFQAKIAEGAAAALYHLRVDREDLYPEPTDADLDSIDPGGIVRAAADKLRATAEGNGSDAGLALAALHRLYIEHKRLESGP